jgi:hypothetical protein
MTPQRRECNRKGISQPENGYERSMASTRHAYASMRATSATAVEPLHPCTPITT